MGECSLFGEEWWCCEKALADAEEERDNGKECKERECVISGCMGTRHWKRCFASMCMPLLPDIVEAFTCYTFRWAIVFVR